MTEDDDQAWTEQLGPAYRLTHVAELLGRTESEVVADKTLLRLDSPAGVPQYPEFQFTTEQRRAAIGKVVLTLADVATTPWTIASWLTSPQPDFNNRTPLQAIDDSDPATVLKHAHLLARVLRH